MPTLQNRVSTSAAMTEPGEAPEDDLSSSPDRRRKRHREVLAIACGVCVLAFLLRELPDGRVARTRVTSIPSSSDLHIAGVAGNTLSRLRLDAIDHPSG